MRPPWFAGCCSAARSDDSVFPEDARLVLRGRRRLWADHRVRQIGAAGLRLVVSGLCSAPSDELARILAAIAAGREDFEALTGLGGSYHVILDDGNALSVAGDLAGLRAVFTASAGGLHVFSSTPLALAGLMGSELDSSFLAARLLCPDAVELLAQSTAFTGIQRVPQDAMLRCAPDGMTLVKRRPLTVQPGYDGDGALREALTAAVAARLTGPVSADLSGGLDSTSLALIATRHGAKNLRAVTYIDPLACGDEDVAYARSVTGLLGGGEHVFVEGETDSLPYCGIEEADPTVFDEPSQEILLAKRARERLAPALGRSVHLGGDGGDVVLAGPLNYLVDLARNHSYRALIREASGLARLRQRPAGTVIRAALRRARSSYAEELIGCATLLDGPELHQPDGWRRPEVEANLAWCRLSPIATWSTPPTAQRLSERLRHLAQDAPGLGADAMALRAIRRHGDLTRHAQRLASTWKINMQMPFFDDPVVSVCTRIPAIERTTMTAAKPLLAAALTGIVPAQVLERRSKGNYTTSEYAGLRAAGAQLRRLMAAPRLADLGLIEPGRIQPILEAAIAGTTSPTGALGDVIAAELWLRADPVATAYTWKR